MVWTAPATGATMCRISVVVEEWRESAYDYKQTLAGLKTTSALHPGADLPGGVSKGLLLTQGRRWLRGNSICLWQRYETVTQGPYPEMDPFESGWLGLEC